MNGFKNTTLMLIAALALGMPAPADAAPRSPGPRPTPVAAPSRVASLPPANGLEAAEALLEDLNFRNLELHDREMLVKSAQPAKSKNGGQLTFSIDSGVFTPSMTIHGAEPSSRSVKGAADAADLASYVRLLDRHRAGALVTGRFSDWRSTSVYRAMAGLHNGYDIAYPAGTTIVAGWSGQVVSIANWYGAEYGITVQSPAGFRTTYGHLSPLTRVGAWVNPGDIVGRVVNDHVDVKMRNAYGGFIDFARGVPGGKGGNYIGTMPSSGADRVSVTLHIHAPASSAPRMLPPLAGPPWTRRGEAVRAAIAYLRVRHQEAGLLMQGASAAPAAVAAVRRQVEEARGRLLVNGVPEEVLLASFVKSEPLQQGAFWFGNDLTGDAQVDVVDDSSRRGEMARTAQDALPQLQALLRDLNAQAPPSPKS